MLSVSRALVALEGKADRRHLDPGNNGGGGGSSQIVHPLLAVADPGEDPGGPSPFLFLEQTGARSAEKMFLETPPPPNLRVWTAPSLSQGLDPALVALLVFK